LSNHNESIPRGHVLQECDLAISSVYLCSMAFYGWHSSLSHVSDVVKPFANGRRNCLCKCAWLLKQANRPTGNQMDGLNGITMCISGVRVC